VLTTSLFCLEPFFAYNDELKFNTSISGDLLNDESTSYTWNWNLKPVVWNIPLYTRRYIPRREFRGYYRYTIQVLSPTITFPLKRNKNKVLSVRLKLFLYFQHDLTLLYTRCLVFRLPKMVYNDVFFLFMMRTNQTYYCVAIKT